MILIYDMNFSSMIIRLLPTDHSKSKTHTCLLIYNFKFIYLFTADVARNR